MSRLDAAKISGEYKIKVSPRGSYVNVLKFKEKSS